MIQLAWVRRMGNRTEFNLNRWRRCQVGVICKSPLSNLVLALKSSFDIGFFVETGTFQAQATVWAAQHFAKVFTFESSDEYYRSAVDKYGHHENIDFILGDSGQALKEVVSKLDQPCICWLDAHAGGGFFGNEDICPLLEEIDALNNSPSPHYIIIDDARAFVAPPPPPFVAERWPPIDQVIGALKKRHDYYIVIIFDVIIAVPQEARHIVMEFCRRLRPKI